MFKRTSGAIVVSLCAGQAVYAQNDGAVQVGKFDLIPVLTTELEYVDNVTYASESSDEISSWVGVISPQISAYTEFDGHEVSMVYRLERGEYFSSDADNYTDHFANVKGDFEINDRNRIKGTLRYEDGHDERGRRYSNGFGNALSSVDTFKEAEAQGVYSYGALSAFGRLDLTVGYEKIDYDNNEQVYLIRDRGRMKYSARFLYRLWDGTNFVVDARRDEINYDYDANPENPLDSNENSVLAGLSWDFDEVTQSFAKIGYKEKTFDAASRDDFSGLAWEVGIRYLPFTYSEITLSTSQDTRETNSEADYIRSTDYLVSWKHSWLQRLSTTATVELMNDDFEGDVEDLRKDDSTKLTLSADYSFRRWLTLGLYYSMSERDSNREFIEYDRNVYGLTARVTL